MTMFSKATVTSTAVIAGKLRLRFRGLFRKVHAIQDVEVTLSTIAPSSPPTDKLPATATVPSIIIAAPLSSQGSEASESEYFDNISEDSTQTDSASEPSTREFPVTPRLHQSPQSLFDFDSVTCDQYSDSPGTAVAFGGVAHDKENVKFLEELDGDELGSIRESIESSESFEADPLGVGSWFVGGDEDDAEYGEEDTFDVSLDGESTIDTNEIGPESGHPGMLHIRVNMCRRFVRFAEDAFWEGIVPQIIGDVAGVGH